MSDESVWINEGDVLFVSDTGALIRCPMALKNLADEHVRVYARGRLWTLREAAAAVFEVQAVREKTV